MKYFPYLTTFSKSINKKISIVFLLLIISKIIIFGDTVSRPDLTILDNIISRVCLRDTNTNAILFIWSRDSSAHLKLDFNIDYDTSHNRFTITAQEPYDPCLSGQIPHSLLPSYETYSFKFDEILQREFINFSKYHFLLDSMKAVKIKARKERIAKYSHGILTYRMPLDSVELKLNHNFSVRSVSQLLSEPDECITVRKYNNLFFTFNSVFRSNVLTDISDTTSFPFWSE